MNEFMEGRIISLLGGRLQPADLARRLAGHMADERQVTGGGAFVPNAYRVFLSPSTLAGFANFEQGLEDELAAFLAAKAEEQGLAFLGRVRVTLLADPELRGDRFRISSDLVDRRGVVISDRAATVEVAATSDQPPPMTLAVGSRRLSLTARSQHRLGRALDNDIVLDDPSVSRRHALLSIRAGSWLLEDQGSSHGSFVNGKKVQAALLRPGDQLQLGGVLLRLTLDGEAD